MTNVASLVASGHERCGTFASALGEHAPSSSLSINEDYQIPMGSTA